MNDNELISVIIPVFNANLSLKKCLDKQLFRSAWKSRRKLIMHLPKQFLYYELFYLNFHFACFLCAAIGK